MSSKFSVLGHLVPLLWAFGKAKHHGGECMVENSCYLVVAMKGGRKSPGTKYTPSDPPPPIGSTLKVSTNSQYATSWGPNPQRRSLEEIL